jgi:hypothetical protein
MTLGVVLTAAEKERVIGRSNVTGIPMIDILQRLKSNGNVLHTAIAVIRKTGDMVRFYDAYTELLSKHGNEQARQYPREEAKKSILFVAETYGVGLNKIQKWQSVINDAEPVSERELRKIHDESLRR